jgi:geranylgeranyl diphosphate synthase type II
MHSLETLVTILKEKFDERQFPATPATLYEPNEYFLSLGGKRIRPVLCLMANELLGEITENAYHAAIGIELFHNFTLIHDDIMDRAPLRRGMQTVHKKYGEPTALLAGDVMLIRAYEHLNKIESRYLHAVLSVFNTTARMICEGQQLDMDFEQQDTVQLNDYLHMIELKTSVLLAASLQIGVILGGGGLDNQHRAYEFGKNLGLAFQLQDDYLDAFGDPDKFGKQVGGDILANKKTFLLIKACEVATEAQAKTLRELLNTNPPDKVDQMLNLFRDCGVDKWARSLKDQYQETAFRHLDNMAVPSDRKQPLSELARYLVEREH